MMMSCYSSKVAELSRVLTETSETINQILGVSLSSWKADLYKSDTANFRLNMFSVNSLSTVFAYSDLPYEAPET